MKFGEAVIIFKNINSEKYTLEEKINAIDVVMKAATINSVFKDDLCEVIRFLLSICTQPADQIPTNEDWFVTLTTEEKAVFMILYTLRRINVHKKTFYETATKSANEAMELTVGTQRLKAYKELLAWLKGEHIEKEKSVHV